MQKFIKKRFRFGKDANKMLERKLLKNFILNGKLVTTEKKIKFIKPVIEKTISLAKKNTNSTKNQILKKFADKKTINIIFNNILPVFKDRKSGFVKYHRLSNRLSDGSIMSKMEWIEPVVIEKNKKKQENIKNKIKSKDKKELKSKNK